MTRYQSDFHSLDEEYSKGDLIREHMRFGIKLYRCFPFAVFIGSLISFYLVIRPVDLLGYVGLLVASAINWVITIIAYNLFACCDVINFIIDRRKRKPE